MCGGEGGAGCGGGRGEGLVFWGREEWGESGGGKSIVCWRGEVGAGCGGGRGVLVFWGREESGGGRSIVCWRGRGDSSRRDRVFV